MNNLLLILAMLVMSYNMTLGFNAPFDKKKWSEKDMKCNGELLTTKDGGDAIDKCN